MPYSQDFSTITPEIWSPAITSFFREKLLAARAFTDLSSDVAEGGDKVHLPHMPDAYTISNISTTSGDMTKTDVVTTQTTLNIDQWKGMSIPITDFQLAQVANKYNIRRLMQQDAGFAMARKFDTDLLEEAYTNAGAEVGDSTTSLNATALEKAMSIIESKSVPKDSLRFIVHPKPYFVDLFKSSKVYDAATFGIPNLPGGEIDVVYGVPIFRTPQVITSTGAYNNLLTSPLGLAWAVGSIPGMQGGAARVEITRAAPSSGQAGSKRHDLEIDLMYGLKAWRTDAIVRIRTTGA